MDTKQKGLCPFCKENVAALIVDEHIVRRDRCLCPKCGESLYSCRNPACHDYAKGTKKYDHEFCSSCAKSAADATKGIISLAGKVLTAVATTALGAFVIGKIGNNNEK